jgi:hypothetical protein
MSLPIRLNRNAAMYPFGQSTLTRVCADLDSYMARTLSVHDKFANLVCAHIDDGRKFARYLLRLIYDSRFGFDDLNSIACGEHPAPTVKNRPSLGLPAGVGPLLSEGDLRIMVAPVVLEV